MARLLSSPPPGLTATRKDNGAYRGVRLTGGAVKLELYAHEDYIRVGILTTDRRVYEAVRGMEGFQIIKPATKWFTGYVRNERGLAAVDKLIRGDFT